MPIPLKGLKTLRTLAGRLDRASTPHQVHLQVACLEIEKARRGSERRSMSRRIAEIDARLQEIEVEKEALLKGMADQHEATRMSSSGGRTGLATRRNGAPFRIRY
jgi:hypothetical protein